MRIWTPTDPVRWTWINLAGRDAPDLLNRILTADVQGLATGAGLPACGLGATGRFRCFFHLWRHGDLDFGLEFDAGVSGAWRTSLLEFLDEMTFGEEVELADVTLSAAGQTAVTPVWLFPDSGEVLPPGLEALRPGLTVATAEELRFCHHGSRQFGRPWISVWGRGARLTQWLDQALPAAEPVSHAELEGLRIEALGPWVDHEITDGTNPLETGLIEAVSRSKGCYPGQEVIERTASRGAPARRLVRLEGEGERPAPGTLLSNLADQPVETGVITTSRETGNGFTALALLRKIHAKESLEVSLPDGRTARILQVAPYEAP